jgi:PKD repeat protein/Flp pilus assembly protein TadG
MNRMPPRARTGAVRSNAPSRVPRSGSCHSQNARSAGQALVEFALVIPVMLLLLVIAVDFGRLFFSYIEITNAAREGAAVGSHAPSNLIQIQATAGQETSSQRQGGENALTITTSCKDSFGVALANCTLAQGGAAGGGNTITVKVDEKFTFLTPLISAFFPNLHMQTNATAVVTDYASSSGPLVPGACSLPVANLVVSVQSGLTVRADPTGSSPNSGICQISGYNYVWDNLVPPTETVGSATGNDHDYPIAGTYVIKLTVTNQAGAASKSVTVTVPAVAPPVCAKPTAQFTFTTTNGNNPLYSYVDKSTVADPVNCQITTWAWVFDNGTLGNAQNPAAFRYGPPDTTHSTTLTVTNAGGSATLTKSTP